MEPLYAAAIKGDKASLYSLLKEDPLILDRSSIIDKPGRFFQSPLHIAVKFGQVEFANELMHKKPNMCLARDQDGCNPVHTAAMEGQVLVLCELLRVKPQAARELTHNGETALHLCVKYDQFDTLQKFVEILDDVELLNFKDNDGNTILHLAVITKKHQFEVEIFVGDGLDYSRLFRTNQVFSSSDAIWTWCKDIALIHDFYLRSRLSKMYLEMILTDPFIGSVVDTENKIGIRFEK